MVQTIFCFYESEGDLEARDLGKMTLGAFRALMLDAKVTTENFRSVQIDDCYVEAMNSGKPDSDKKDSKANKKASTDSTSMSIKEFILGLCALSNKKFTLGLESPTWGHAELYVKLGHLIHDLSLIHI